MRKLLIAMLLVIAVVGYAQGAEPFDFVVIQPGQPGSSQDAQPVMDALAAYLRDKLGSSVTVRGHYFNEASAASAFLATHQPRWGIVSLGYFLTYHGAGCLVPLAATRPGGADSDVWRLMVVQDGPDDWRAVNGSVEGTMLFQPQVAARLMFRRPVGGMPFALKGTFRPLSSLRNLSRGKGAGVILDKPQFDAIQALPQSSRLKVIAASDALPTPAVVSFGPPGKLHARLYKVLQSMKQDPAAADLLKLLQTDGFGPPDARLKTLKGKGL
ncbi:MAG: hypothetical protein AB7E65_05080 [Syntrophotalea sp.]|jgi:ABC-type phosphate/phosphonate transport system substrate-binding protein|uniref:PhnD/SsuA/transferrin family substrate-binding protein n=1 Tax=Syntrophotalea sp. TaxID=2812029 RepID=UPI003D14264F